MGAGYYCLKINLFCSLQQMMLAGGDTPESCLKDDVDWLLENSLLAIELLNVDNWKSFSLQALR